MDISIIRNITSILDLRKSYQWGRKGNNSFAGILQNHA